MSAGEISLLYLRTSHSYLVSEPHYVRMSGLILCTESTVSDVLHVPQAQILQVCNYPEDVAIFVLSGDLKSDSVSPQDWELMRKYLTHVIALI